MIEHNRKKVKPFWEQVKTTVLQKVLSGIWVEQKLHITVWLLAMLYYIAAEKNTTSTWLAISSPLGTCQQHFDEICIKGTSKLQQKNGT